jgi:P4 family phage/plasmid primase-like protien
MPKKVKKQDMPELILQDKKYQRDLMYCERDRTFYLYQKGWYKAMPKKNMLAEIRNFLIMNERTSNIDLGVSIYKDVFDQLVLSLIYQGATRENYDLEYMAFNDCMFNFDTLEKEEISDNERKFTPFHLEFDWSDLMVNETKSYEKMGVLAPNFISFLETSIVFEGTRNPDYETIKVIQEMLGYYLTATQKKTVAFFLIGNGANGKSILANVIRFMFPHEYVSANSLEELTMDATRLAGLVGKKINIASEEESKKMKNDKFKALVGGDLIEARRLYEESFSFVNTCKLLFLTNKAPRFQSVDNGIKRRVEIIKFPRDFEEKEQDRSLLSKIKGEIKYIVGWAINGAKRLVRNNYVFSKSDNTENAKKSFINDMSTALTFVVDNYDTTNEKGNNGYRGTELYNKYKIWIDEVGKKSYAMGRDSFYDHIDRNFCKSYKYRNTKYFPLIEKSSITDESDIEEGINPDEIIF